MNNAKQKIVIAFLALALVAAGVYVIWEKNKSDESKTANQSASSNEQASSNNQNQQAASTVNYTNDEYGLEFDLPKSWKGYTIVWDQWNGYSVNAAGDQKIAAEGVQISLRHPQWTKEKPRQDIPIMIFTLAQWNDLQADKFHIGAAPINPSELGRNNKYVFALPARYNYAFPEGYEEVENILKGEPLHTKDI